MNRALIGLGVALAVMPLALGGHYLMGISVLVGIFTLAALGLDLLFGFAGQLSLGQAAFMGIGAYSSALLTTRLNLGPVPALLAGVLLAALIALIVGRPVLKLRGYYLVVATLAGGLAFELVLVGWRDFSGGPSGLTGIPAFGIGKFVLTSDTLWHYFVWGLVLLVLTGLRALTGGRVGRALKAIAADNVAASVLSINVATFKLQAFVISAVLSAVAGSLYAHYMRFISPEMVGMQASFALVTMVVLGGMGHLWGVLIGVALLKVLPELIGWMQDYQLIIHGLLLMLLMIGMPRGIAGGLTNLLKRKGVAMRGRPVEGA